MINDDEAVIVFTAKGTEQILNEGGSSAWRIDRTRAHFCGFVVCTRNAKSEWVAGLETHHAAFLIGKLKDVVPSPEHKGRYILRFSEYAIVDFPNVWKGERNPVKYSTLSNIGIDPSRLKWQPMPEPSKADRDLTRRVDSTPLSLTEAKERLAHTFGVSPTAIEIIVRG
jgi:hypothetical protein